MGQSSLILCLFICLFSCMTKWIKTSHNWLENICMHFLLRCSCFWCIVNFIRICYYLTTLAFPSQLFLINRRISEFPAFTSFKCVKFYRLPNFYQFHHLSHIHSYMHTYTHKEFLNVLQV